MSAATPTTADLARARSVVGAARVVSCVLLPLGLLAALNTGIDDLGGDSAENLFVFLVHPLTALAWIAIGLTGIAMAARPDTARLFCIVAGGGLLAWAALALLAGDGATQVLTRDPPVVALHLIGAAACLAAAFAPLPAPLARILGPRAGSDSS